MAGVTNFPTSADDFSTQSPVTLGTADAVGRTHSERHDDVEAAMEAVQTVLTAPRRNFLLNGAMRIDQRYAGSTYTTDDAYSLDRWNFLHEGTCEVSRLTAAPPTGFSSYMKLSTKTGGEASKFGAVQVVESVDTTPLVGKEVTFSFYAVTTDMVYVDDVRAAIISWSGTADSVTSDVVSAWNSDGVNPTLAANWTYENTPADLGVTQSWARYSVTATVDTASTTNVAVLVWRNNKNVNGGDFRISGAQLEIGPKATVFDHASYGDDLAGCQRYYWAVTGSSGQVVALSGSAIGVSSTKVDWYQSFPVPMRIVPAPAVSAASHIRWHDTVATATAASVVAQDTGWVGTRQGMMMQMTTTGATAYRPLMVDMVNSGGVSLYGFNAEL